MADVPEILVYLFGCSILKYTSLYFLSKKRPSISSAKKVGHVKTLYIYPAKSIKGMEVESVQLTVAGTEYAGVKDRTWMITADNRKRFVTQRQQPTLSLVTPSMQGDELHLSAPGMPVLKLSLYQKSNPAQIKLMKVFGDELETVDCGAEAATWISEYLKEDNCNIVFAAPGLKKRVLVHGTADAKYTKNANNDSVVAFADVTPYHLFSEASVNDLNSKIQGAPITQENFRPGIVVAGSEAFEEDNWEYVFIGEAVLRRLKLTDRCILTTVNHQVGKKRDDQEPLVTLRKYRKFAEFKNSPCFGTSLVLEKPGVVKTGEAVYATISPWPN